MAHVLIVDDQPYVREFLSEELAHDGYRTETIGDPDSIWGHLTHWRPDVVLLDLYLDGSKGWDILQDIRNTYCELPVILCSAYTAFKYDLKSIAADYFVVKSSDFSELKVKIKMALEEFWRSQK